MSVSVRNDRSFGGPQELFELEGWLESSVATNYDTTPDGTRFLAARQPRAAARSIDVVINWAEELKRQVPR